MPVAAVHFIWEHRPWKGLLKHRWAFYILTGVGLLVGWELIRVIIQIAGAMRTALSPDLVAPAGFWGRIDLGKFTWILHGGQKYLVLIILEIFTFHFIRQTLSIRTGLVSEHSFKSFTHAEKRMMSVSLQAWVLKSISRGIAYGALGIVGLKTLKMPVGYLIEFYFLGYILVGNYLECFSYKVRESEKIVRTMAGVAVAVGLVAFLLMKIPAIGIVLATTIGSVAATLAMERFATDLPAPKAQMEQLV